MGLLEIREKVVARCNPPKGMPATRSKGAHWGRRMLWRLRTSSCMRRAPRRKKKGPRHRREGEAPQQRQNDIIRFQSCQAGGGKGEGGRRKGWRDPLPSSPFPLPTLTLAQEPLPHGEP